MIRITKPIAIPSILTSAGKTADDLNRKNYDADPKSYIAGKEIVILNSIYGHTSVKQVLKKAQHNKCCFCEKDQVDEYGAVEHFRPKLGYKSKAKDKLIKPGYYWLGYNWNNIFFVCSGCNSAGNKGNLFPLKDETKRAKSHNDDEKAETPYLIDPCGKKDPRKHIIFKDQFATGLTAFGKKTIEICGIKRDELNEKRKKLLGDIDARIAILSGAVHLPKTDVDKAKLYIKNCVKPEAEFSAAARDYLNKFNITIT